MGLDLVTFLVQLVNLFILIWILKRYLYRPVLAIIDKRRQEINSQIQQAEEKLATTTNLEQDLLSQKKAFETQKQKRMDNLEKEIIQQRSSMLKELDSAYNLKCEKLQQSLNDVWDNAQNSIHEMIASEFMILSQKVLSEWADQSSMDQVIKLLGKKLSGLSKAKKDEVQKLLLKQKSIQVFASETLSKKQQETIREILGKSFTLPQKLRVQFKKKDSLILGIEIRLDNFLLDWNLNTYLEELNQHLKQNISSLISSAKRKANK